MRWPVAYAFLVLSKVAPGVTALWWVVRREWRNLAIGLGSAAIIVAISFALSPATWFSLDQPHLDRVEPGVQPDPVPLLVRLPFAALVAIYAGSRTDPSLAPARCGDAGAAAAVGPRAGDPRRDHAALCGRETACRGPPGMTRVAARFLDHPAILPGLDHRRCRASWSLQVMGAPRDSPSPRTTSTPTGSRAAPTTRTRDDRERLRRLGQPLQVPLPAAARPGLRPAPPAAVPARRRALDRDALRDRPRPRRTVGAARPPLPADARRALSRQRQPADRARDRRRVPLAGRLGRRDPDEDHARHRAGLVRARRASGATWGSRWSDRRVAAVSFALAPELVGASSAKR